MAQAPHGALLRRLRDEREGVSANGWLASVRVNECTLHAGVDRDVARENRKRVGSRTGAASPSVRRIQDEAPAWHVGTVPAPLKAESLAYWDESQGKFVVEPESVEILAAASSADVRQRKTITVGQ